MNDRASQVPPTNYIGDEELRERHEREENARGRKMAHPRKFYSTSSTAASSADRSESRHSSIFRFGKSLAATFNPSNWKIWSKQEQVEEETAQQKTLRERQLKAQQIYHELKQSGQFRDSAVPPTFGLPDFKDLTPARSGAYVRASNETTLSEKRKGRVFLDAPQLSSYDASPVSNRAGSVAASNCSGHKSGFSIRRASFTSLRKTGSDNSGSNTPADGLHQPRRVPSRKDLHKQQKLVKRVSNLEGKLDAARRQLAQSLSESIPPKMPPPERTGRPRFVPGALSSLPSERLLAGYVSPDEDTGMSENETFGHIGRAVTTERGGKPDIVMAGGVESYELEEDAPAPPSVRKNKPLPKATHSTSQDHVMQSVERENTVEVNPAKHSMLVTKTKSRPAAALVGPSVAISDQGSEISSLSSPESQFDRESDDNFAPTESTDVHIKGESDEEMDLVPEEEDEEPTEEPETESEYGTKRKRKHQDPKKKPARNFPPQASKAKKRKSVFEREVDKSGRFVPPAASESSTQFSKPKKAKTTTSPSASQSKKLQKTVQGTAPAKPSPMKDAPSIPAAISYSPTQTNRTQPPRRGTPKKAPVASAHSNISRSSSKLSKSKIPRKSSAGTPPPASFGTLDYPKPKNGKGSKKTPDEMYSAIPSAEGDVPPMPKLPKTVRLPSGEMVNVEASKNYGEFFAKGGGVGKLTKVKPGTVTEKEMKDAGGLMMGERKDAGMNREDSFEWDKDVF